MSQSDRNEGGWAPLLEGAAAEEALAVALEVAEALSQPPEQHWRVASLYGGLCGMAVLEAYAARQWPERGFEEVAARHLDQAAETLSSHALPPSLAMGFTGVAWAAAHLGWGDDEACDEIDEALASVLAISPWPGDYDLIDGLVGFGTYALERHRRPSAALCLGRVLDRFEELARVEEVGTSWITPPEHALPGRAAHPDEGYYDVGVAHGVAGIAAVLAGMVEVGFETARARRLLEGLGAWLLAHRLPEDGDSRFPDVVNRGVAPRPTRSGWCYGDPGVGVVLLRAGQLLGEASLVEAGCDALERAARRSSERVRALDAGLCHGAAGIAHIFHRAYRMTGRPQFAEAARRWFASTLAMRKNGEGVAGYQALLPVGEGELGMVSDPGFLTGAAGIALALLAAATPIEPSWDRLLLLSGYSPAG